MISRRAFFSFLAGGPGITALFPWFARKPTLANEEITGFVEFDRDIIYVCTESGRIYKLEGTGATWQEQIILRGSSQKITWQCTHALP